MSELKNKRNELHEKLLDQKDALDIIQGNWLKAKGWIEDWWTAYKDWERNKDNFNKAVLDARMTVRSFGSSFAFQLNKTKPVGIADSRFLSPGREKLPVQDHKGPYASLGLAAHQRGLNTSAYANPANFSSRKTKYDHGLHDLSVSLMVPGQDVKANCHHQSELTPHFCFLPLSKGEDQYVIYRLGQYAKVLKTAFPEMDTLIRDYRSKMTRVKLSSDYDMGTGYSAVPTPDREDGLTYKVTYTLGNTLKERGSHLPKKTTMERLQQRQQFYFKHRHDIIKYGANELVIAMRQHAGPFPVYGVYDKDVIRCFDIVDGEKVMNGNTISVLGKASWC